MDSERECYFLRLRLRSGQQREQTAEHDRGGNTACRTGHAAGEHAEQTALREIREETGLEVLNMRYISSYYYPKHDNLMLGYLCTVKHGEFRLSGEVDTAGWFGLEEARELLSHGTVGKDLMRDSLRMNDER